MALPPLRPNTEIFSPAYHYHTLGQPPTPLDLHAWQTELRSYPDLVFKSNLLAIIRYGAAIGYTGSRHSNIRLSPNLPIANEHEHIIDTDITTQLGSGAISIFQLDAFTPCYIPSPLGLVDKSDGSKRRIHHLSFPEGNGVNQFIRPEHYTISYSGLDDAINLIRKVGRGAVMLKRDLKDAFRHIAVSPLDHPLLGFTWRNTHYTDNRLPFGLRSSPTFQLFRRSIALDSGSKVWMDGFTLPRRLPNSFSANN